MKKSGFVIFFLFAILTACHKEDTTKWVLGCSDPNSLNYDSLANLDNHDCIYPEKKQKALLMDFTATWCGACGSWGIPTFTSAVEAYPDEVVPLAIHDPTDEMANPTATMIGNIYAITAYPTIIVQNGDFINGPQDLSTAIESVIAQEPSASVVGSLKKVGDSLQIKTMAVFYKSLTGSFFLAAYIMEDSLNYPQASITDPDFRHNHVLRGTPDFSAYGDPLQTGEVSANTIFRKSHMIALDPQWNIKNLYLSVVLWNIETGHEVINAWRSGKTDIQIQQREKTKNEVSD